MESRLEKIFSMGINNMSLAVWLGKDRKCSAAVVGLNLLLGLSMVRRCSINRSLRTGSCNFVRSINYCNLMQFSSISAILLVQLGVDSLLISGIRESSSGVSKHVGVRTFLRNLRFLRSIRLPVCIM